MGVSDYFLFGFTCSGKAGMNERATTIKPLFTGARHMVARLLACWMELYSPAGMGNSSLILVVWFGNICIRRDDTEDVALAPVEKQLFPAKCPCLIARRFPNNEEK